MYNVCLVQIVFSVLPFDVRACLRVLLVSTYRKKIVGVRESWRIYEIITVKIRRDKPRDTYMTASMYNMLTHPHQNAIYHLLTT